ncbi:protein O-linked-mannose beta-1,2-N-acetylglucosaminyltransferase 1-like isoform X2 [Macrobrachium rosenbergii]|uniref:protein O-linked-mannose beta-1,2-N-acetylglucosaminyltransferase 1-like isoform X2 n=1 Tax=Macrobrachium rosenbergii TaxID=79674 RepID=UPI0034D6079A
MPMPPTPSTFCGIFEHILHFQDQMEIREVIPCVILTSREPYNFYRLLLQLTQLKGAGQTPFLVQFGGDAPVSEELVKLFNLPFSKEIMTSSNGDLENVTSSIASLTYKSISSAFERFPQAKKVIIIEDDLILSPDFLWYFQQTSTLLDEDPTILAVSAHRIQSSGHGRDPAHILRGKAPPQWGWMADRRILKKWVPKYWGDWDYWIMSLERADGIDIIFPELSRSLHAGSSGTHIDGFAQAMIYNLESANVQKSINISNLSELQIDKYRSKMARDITRAVPVSLTGPENCQTPLQLPFDKETPLVMYINDYRERYAIFLCLGGFYQDLREDFDSVHQINVEGWKLFLVECPASPYCFQKPPSYTVVPYNDDVMEALWGLHMFRNSKKVRSAFRLRRQAFSIEEELELRNTEVGYAVIGLDIPTLFLSKAFILPLWGNGNGHEYKTATQYVSASSLQGNESEKRNKKAAFVGSKNAYKDGCSKKSMHHTHQNSIHNIHISSEKVIHKYGGKSDGNNSNLSKEKRERGCLGKPPTPSLTLLRTLKEPSVQEHQDFANQVTSRMTKEREKLFSAVIQRSTTSSVRSDLTYYLTCISVTCVAADPLLQINKLPKLHRLTASLILEEVPVLYDITKEFTVKDYFDNPLVLNSE